MSPDLINQIVERNDGAGKGLISSLLEIQTKYGYLPEESLRSVARAANRSLVEVYGVATFYRAFSLTPRGRHLVSCCLGTACHVRGAPSVAEEIEKQLKVAPGRTTPDEEFTFETVNCLGACALGPIVVVDGRYFSAVNIAKIPAILHEAKQGTQLSDISLVERYFPIEVSCSYCSHSLIDTGHSIDSLPSIKLTLSFGDKHGWLRLSSLYGSYTSQSQHEVPLEEVVQIFCPSCHAELSGGDFCAECGNRMVPMLVRGGGTLQICPRHGCKGHNLDLN